MLIKKILSLVLALIIFAVPFFNVSFAVSVSAESAVVINAQTDDILYEKNAFEKRSMASTTKIMTAIIAIESGRLNDEVEITTPMTVAEGTSIDLKIGQRISLMDLVYGMMLESGNDAADAVAIYLSGSLEAFAETMNRKASQLGMKNSNFVTPSGLDDEAHYSTAYDMALLASYCIKNTVFRNVCSTKSYTATLLSPVNHKMYFSNHNRLLESIDGVFGVKTGFTKKSGRCLISAIEKESAILVAVTLGAPDDWNDHEKLFEHCLASFEKVEVSFDFPEKLPVIGGTSDTVGIITGDYQTTICVPKEGTFTQIVFLPRFIYAPIDQGDCIGSIQLVLDGKAFKTINLYAGEKINSIEETFSPKKGFFAKVKDRLISFF